MMHFVPSVGVDHLSCDDGLEFLANDVEDFGAVCILVGSQPCHHQGLNIVLHWVNYSVDFNERFIDRIMMQLPAVFVEKPMKQARTRGMESMAGL